MMNTTSSRKKIIGLTAALCVACMAVFSLAYFTDIVGNTDDPMHIGIAEKNIEIVPTDPTPDPGHTPGDDPGDEIEYIWGNNNPDTIGKLVEPGDHTVLDYNIENGGPGAMDVRETFVLHSSVDMSDWEQYEAAVKANGGVDPTDKYAPEYWLFKAAEADANGAFGYFGSSQIDGVKVTKIDAQTYKFEVPSFVLNGTSEKVTGGVESKELKYQLVFDKYARNNFQASNCQVNYLIEVKQHTYDDPSKGWDELASVDIQMGESKSGAYTVKGVPGGN